MLSTNGAGGTARQDIPPPRPSTLADAMIARAADAGGRINLGRLAADLNGVPAAARGEARRAVDARLTPVQRGELARRVDALGAAMPPSAPPPETRSLSLGDHVADGARQFGGALWDTVKGVGSLAGGVARTAYDTSLAGHATDAILGADVPAWLPSAQRGQQRVADAATMLRQAGQAIWRDPSILIEEYRELAAEGRYGAIVGQALADFGDLLIGSKGAGTAARGAGAVGDVARVANGAGAVADTARIVKASDSAAALARAAAADPAFAERARPALEQARATLAAADDTRLAPDAREAVATARRQLDEALSAAAPRYVREVTTALPRMTTNLGRKLLALAVKSPSLMADLKALEAAGWEVRLGTPGAGTRAIPGQKRIVLDPRMVDTPERGLQLLAHEVGHARFTETRDLSSRAAYVDQRLRDEGAATMSNIRVQREIQARGGPNVGIAGNAANHPEYNRIYDRFLRDGDARAAQDAIGRLFATGETASGTGGKNYRQFYSDQYSTLRPGRP